ncbi:MAG TPA: amidohydrolase [Dehalococcoidia bacterium]|nr:amidohydrolase [Dehalococcoidia bacterium]
MSGTATRVFFNGTVHTLDGRRSTASAIALAGGRVLATGGDAAMCELAAPNAVLSDLQGRTVVPGLIDSHNHLLQTGLNAEHVDLAETRSVRDVLDAIGARAARTEPGGWVISSSRWHESQLEEQRFPTRVELDAVTDGRTVLLRRGGHNVVASSAALARAGIGDETPNPRGGTFVRDAAGRLSGHVIGRPAYERLTRLLPDPSEEQMIAAIARACRLYTTAGITGVIEPGLGAAELRAYQQARRTGVLNLRTVLMPRLAPGTDEEMLKRALSDLKTSPLLTGLGDDWLRIGGIKIVADGGVETNYLREPYAHADDLESPRGKPQVSEANLAAVCGEAAKLGWQVGVHCVGDAAIDLVLAAFEAAHQAASIRDLRWTLIHMILARPEHFETARRLGLCVAAQQPLIYALGAGWVKYWGSERAAAAMPLREFAESGLPVGGGSDSPVTPYQPLLGIWSSATRETQLAGVLGSAQAIAPAEALAWYTRGSAWLSFDEGRRGSLEPGKLADLVVLSADPLAVPAAAITEIAVEETLVDGRRMFPG